MLVKEDIQRYPHAALLKLEHILMLSPHKSLLPYIANYTFTCPENMVMEQSVLPSASSTLAFSVIDDQIVSGLRGVNSRTAQIGNYACTFSFMALIEFHPAGLYPFLKIEQSQFLDQSCALQDLNKVLFHFQIFRNLWDTMMLLISSGTSKKYVILLQLNI